MATILKHELREAMQRDIMTKTMRENAPVLRVS